MKTNAAIPSFFKSGKEIVPTEDPTRTKMLRAGFVRQIRKRWKAVKKEVPAILKRAESAPVTMQVNYVLSELERIEAQTILAKLPLPWITPFVRASFVRGMMRGNLELRKLTVEEAKGNIVTNAIRFAVNQVVEIATISPSNVDAILSSGARAELLAMEVETTWQGITAVTAQVNAQVGIVLVQSIQSRLTIKQTTAAINDRIDKIGITRGELIARTEVVAANNVGAVAEYEAASLIIGEPIYVQWQATLDSKVRATHLARHGKVFKRSEYLKLIRRPRCRCAGLPYRESVEGKVELSKGSLSDP
jgi:hypothetical protein